MCAIMATAQAGVMPNIHPSLSMWQKEWRKKQVEETEKERKRRKKEAKKKKRATEDEESESGTRG